MNLTGLALAVGLGAGLSTFSAASSTTIYVTPHNGSVFGQTVTFTASFNVACGHDVGTHYFVIDRKTDSGVFKQEGSNATETLALSTLAVGRHAVVYQWQAASPSGSSCQGAASVFYVVSPTSPPTQVPATSSSASPSPSPSAEPSPSPISSLPDVVSATKVQLKTAPKQPPPEYGYLAGALIALALWAGAGLMLIARE
jgi:hypothetical protein